MDSGQWLIFGEQICSARKAMIQPFSPPSCLSALSLAYRSAFFLLLLYGCWCSFHGVLLASYVAFCLSISFSSLCLSPRPCHLSPSLVNPSCSLGFSLYLSISINALADYMPHCRACARADNVPSRRRQRNQPASLQPKLFSSFSFFLC